MNCMFTAFGGGDRFSATLVAQANISCVGTDLVQEGFVGTGSVSIIVEQATINGHHNQYEYDGTPGANPGLRTVCLDACLGRFDTEVRWTYTLPGASWTAFGRNANSCSPTGSTVNCVAFATASSRKRR